MVVDQNAGRPGRQIQWSVGIQREIFTNLAVEPNYAGNRGAWWQAFQFVNYNALSPTILAQRGLSLNNPADITLLNSPLNSALASQRGFNNPLYTGFPITATVAQSLGPFLAGTSSFDSSYPSILRITSISDLTSVVMPSTLPSLIDLSTFLAGSVTAAKPYPPHVPEI